MTPVCHSDEIAEGASRGFEIDGLKLIALKKQGQIYLYLNRCPHLGLPLEFQPNDFLSYDQDYVQCSTHGALFTLDSGLCVLGPCKGQALKALDYEIHHGLIVVTGSTLAAIRAAGN